MDPGELEERARERLDAGVYDYIAGGAFDELTVAANVADWAAIRLRPRVLRAVGRVDATTTVLGRTFTTPVGIAPTAFHCLAHPDGELATAAEAREAGALYVVSTRSTTPIEAIGRQLEGHPFWYQVYVLADEALSDDLVDRAVAAGASALVLTADTPVVGRRLRALANRFVPTEVFASPGRPAGEGAGEQHPDVTFDDVGRLAARTGLPVVVKGVLRGDDARACLDAGAAGVWVSNHGGRQLDGAVSTAVALPEVCQAVAGDGEVYVDGGVRRGTDVLKALAAGARAVFVGRPVLWALAAGGGGAVAELLGGLHDELELAMRLAGAPTLAEVSADLLGAGPVGVAHPGG